MARPLPVIPPSVMYYLPDQLEENKRKAAIELEGIVKLLAVTGEDNTITAVINSIVNYFAHSPCPHHRMGGLIGLAAITAGLNQDASNHLEQIVHPVVSSFCDGDSRVRYWACEALKNIAEVVRGLLIVFLDQIFHALCSLSEDSDADVRGAADLLDRTVMHIFVESDQFRKEEFIPLLEEHMNVLNPYVSHLLLRWITTLDMVPENGMPDFLPNIIEGLFSTLGDPSHEIRQKAESALSEFLHEIKNLVSVDYGHLAEILVPRAERHCRLC